MLNNLNYQYFETFISIIVYIHNFLFRCIINVIYFLNDFFKFYDAFQLIILNNINKNIFSVTQADDNYKC